MRYTGVELPSPDLNKAERPMGDVVFPAELFRPNSVAVLGASRNPGKVGHSVFVNLVGSGFPGTLYGVNRAGGELLGRPLYREIESIPGTVDLGVFVVPPADVVQAVPRLAAKGMRAAIVISAGFREVGGEGAVLERALREALAAASVRAVGPNSLGVIDTHARLNASFAAGIPPSGSIAFFSQSGALCTALLDWAEGEGIGFSKVVSLGNEADISEADLMELLSDDPETRVILGYVESIGDGRRFLRAAAAATAKKPVILLKAGATSAGARAASSHTGCLAGSDRAYTAAFRQGGILRAETIEDLCDVALGFAMQPLPRGNRLMIVTNAGGPAILAADMAEKLGIPLAEVSAELRGRLASRLPATASLGNPVDLVGDAREDRYRGALEEIRDDPCLDSVLVLLTPQAMTEPEATARAVVSALSGSGKTSFASFLGDRSVREARQVLKKGGIPHYTGPERAVRSLRAMIDFRDFRGAPSPDEGDSPGGRPPAVAAAIQDALARGGRTLGEEGSRGILEAYGFRFPGHLLARTSREAVGAFQRLGGGPAAMKIVSPGILHKTEVGGVRLDVRSPREVEHAFLEITSAARRMVPGAWIEGVSVQEMVRGGLEVILGMSCDPQFGPLLMFGLGGIHVEVLRDVSFRVAPVSRREAEAMVREIRGYPLLAGFRGSEPADEEAIADAILRLSKLSVECPEIVELDLNPVMAMPKGRGLLAIDCRMVLAEGKR
jgi:acetate---CoA ligase (ADP-forming)